MPGWPRAVPHANPYLGNGGAGFVLWVQRLGIPIIQMSDAAYGVRSSGENGRYLTALPSNVAAAASWDVQAACAYGALIGRELRAQGYNMSLGGGVNLTRDPRNGRTFEYMGEDPVLAGTLVGDRVKCEQAQHVIGDMKHYALNDQESGRNEVNAIIGKRAMRESDLLAFQIGIGIADPAAVMCSYNAEQSIVLLKNDRGILPLDRAKLHSIAVIGPNADTSMISGGGSAQVDPPGHGATKWKEHVWFPSSPLKAIARKTPGATVEFDSGADRASAAALAKKSDVAIVFAYQWTSEDFDLPSLSLPDNQDALIEQVAAANPRTIVVLETGSAVTMPWLNQVGGALEAWYAGSKGEDAVANILFGDVNPSAKLPMTFPRSEADLPHPHLVTPPPQAPGSRNDEAKPRFEVHYDEGLKVGYKWYDAENKPVLFPFGYGLSYTTFSYSGLKVTSGSETTVSFTVKNTGSRAGAEIAEVYAAVPASAGEPPKRLVGWDKLHLNAGEGKEVSVSVRPLYLSVYDEASNSWKVVPGSYTFMVGGSSQNLPLVEKVNLK